MSGSVSRSTQHGIRASIRRGYASFTGRHTIGRALIYLLLGVYALGAILAFLWVLLVSLKSNPEFIGSSPWSLPKDWLFSNYVNAFTIADIGAFFLNSVLVTAAATALSVAVSCLAAYVIARIPFGWNQIILQGFLIGLMVPPILIFIPLYTLLNQVNLLNTRTGLVLVYATANMPFNIFVLSGFMKTLPTELEEAAAMDGATPFETFLRILLPLCTPGIVSVAVLNILNNWNEFFYALAFLTDASRYTLPLGLYTLSQMAEYSSAWVTLFAGLIITAVPMLLIFALLQDRITEGLTAGALKG